MNGSIEPQIIMANKDADDSEDEILKLAENRRCDKHDGESGIKREPEEESDIQNFAETTMNELLGWYGYDKVDSRDTQSLRLTVHRFTNNNDQDRCGKSSGNNTPPTSPHSNENSSSSDVANGVDDSFVSCSWCKKIGSKLYTLQTSNGTKTFCSEACFNQCRRASFKKYKICDWCKHVRHTVNYVDFQDGEQQLQFCSDKCLNQYKMHIFCKEAQAHLQMHQHLSQPNSKKSESGKHSLSKSAHTLITPEMWMRDCKDDSLSDENPAEPEVREQEKPSLPEKPNPDLRNPPSSLKFPASSERRRRLHRAKERRHNRRELSGSSEDVIPKNEGNKNSVNLSHANGTFPSPNCSSSNLDSSNLRLPSLSEPQAPPPAQPRFPSFMHGMSPPAPNFGFNYPRNFFMDQVPSFFPRPPPPPILPPSSLGSGNLLPPPTLMIPYPVMFPVPVPIPIPIPLPIRECDWKQLMARKGLLPNETQADACDVSEKSFVLDQKSTSSAGSSRDSTTSGGEQSKSGAESEEKAGKRKGRVEERAVEAGDGSESKRKCLRTRLSAK